MNPPHGPGYHVSLSVAVRESLVRLRHEAAGRGSLGAFLIAFRTITTRLSTDPVAFGEELYDLHALHLTFKLAVVLPLAVEFGVYVERRLVFVRGFRYISPG